MTAMPISPSPQLDAGVTRWGLGSSTRCPLDINTQDSGSEQYLDKLKFSNDGF